jgi:hypothetical protein
MPFRYVEARVHAPLQFLVAGVDHLTDGVKLLRLPAQLRLKRGHSYRKVGLQAAQAHDHAFQVDIEFVNSAAKSEILGQDGFSP